MKRLGFARSLIHDLGPGRTARRRDTRNVVPPSLRNALVHRFARHRRTHHSLLRRFPSLDRIFQLPELGRCVMSLLFCFVFLVPSENTLRSVSLDIVSGLSVCLPIFHIIH